MTLLGNHDQELTAEERQAIADEARPGVWVERDPTAAEGLRGDGRKLEQHETDKLIVLELFTRHVPKRFGVLDSAAHSTLWGIAGPPYATVLPGLDRPEREHPVEQRGGLHSDPAVRLLAFRAWGDRDRRFFELRRDEPVFIDQDGFAITYPKNGVPMIGTAVSEPRDDGTIDVRTDANHRDSTIISRTISKLPWRR